LRTIESVGRGESALDSSMTEAVFKEVRQAEKSKAAAVFSELSPQEMRVLALIADGLTNREIAGKLILGVGTVRNYVCNLLSKLLHANLAEAAAFAIQHKIQDPLLPDQYTQSSCTRLNDFLEESKLGWTNTT